MADAATSIAMPEEFARRARRWAFRDPSIEAIYREWHRERILPIARGVGFGSMVLWALIPLWFELTLGEVPHALYISNWAVAVPAFLGVLLASYTGLRRWAVGAISALNIFIGLDAIWIMSSLYGPVSGAVVCGVFTVIYFPLVLRLPTGATAVVATTLSAVPVALLVNGVQRGDVALKDSWPYIVMLVQTVPILVGAAALIEIGMRQQFAAEQTVARQQSQLQVSQRLLRKYAPAAVAERIESGEAEAVGRPQRLRVTAMSSDVAGFTALADRIDPESLSHIINEYVAIMSGVVEGQHGVVTEFAGDGLMAIFGAPEHLEPADQVRHALAAADAMHARLAELSESWYPLGTEQPLKVRVGINTGMLSVGTFGSDGRATYTAIGLQMNVAARIQAQCEPGRTLLSGASWHLVKDDVECEPLGEVTVKGVHFPISIYAPRS